jgi:uncharacterized membrane protein YeaQ/YmgE (transglycosylase-associated protein family)
MKQIFQVGRFIAYFLVGLLAYYFVARASAYVLGNILAALVGAVIVGLIGGLVAGLRSQPPIDGTWSWRLKAGSSWCMGAILGGPLLSFLVMTPFLPNDVDGESPIIRIIQKLILVCLPNDPYCKEQQYYGTMFLMILLSVVIGALGAIAGGELARRRYVGKGRSGIRSAD